jgi:Holliday junction resolvase RusA-like endonuclease
MPAQKAWRDQADALYLIQKRKIAADGQITGPFEALITICSSCRLDLDNGLKLLLDTARDYGLVPDDSPKYLRKLTVQFGEAPEGARLTLTQISSCVGMKTAP